MEDVRVCTQFRAFVSKKRRFSRLCVDGMFIEWIEIDGCGCFPRNVLLRFERLLSILWQHASYFLLFLVLYF